MEAHHLKSFRCNLGPKIVTEYSKGEQNCHSIQIRLTMSMNTPISSENRWPHTLVVQIKWRLTGSRLSKIRQQKCWKKSNRTTTRNEDTKSDGWWWQMMKLVTLRVTARRRSLCSYQCGNSGGVHWSVSRRHQHRLQNNRRKRVIVHGMRMGTGGRTVGTTLFILLFVHVFFLFSISRMMTSSSLAHFHFWVHSRAPTNTDIEECD